MNKYLTRILLGFFFIALFSLTNGVAQNIAIGAWRHHLPNNNIISIVDTPNKIYGATEYGILELDKKYNSLKKLDKVNGLSDLGIRKISYYDKDELVLVGYNNGTIDVIEKNGRIRSIFDVRQANILGSKGINRFYYEESIALISTDFGIIKLDINQRVILDTWFIGEGGSMLQVNDLLKKEGSFYAATNQGLYLADSNAPNLADFQYWQTDETLMGHHIEELLVFNNTLFAVAQQDDFFLIYSREDGSWNLFDPLDNNGVWESFKRMNASSDFLFISSERGIDIIDKNFEWNSLLDVYPDNGRSISANDMVITDDDMLLLGDRSRGMARAAAPYTTFMFYTLPGTPFSDVFNVAHNGEYTWVASGAILNQSQNTWNNSGVYLWNNRSWRSYNRWVYEELEQFRDFHQITPIPTNPNGVVASTWYGGLAVLDRKEGVTAIYDHTNSTLRKRDGVEDFVRVGGTAYDRSGNLWVSNSDTQNFLSVKTPDGNWFSYRHGGVIGHGDVLRNVLIDRIGQKWISMPRGGGIIVFKENQLADTLNFEIKKLGTQEGNGGLPSGRVLSMAMDYNGYIWVGTNSGVVVFYAPQNVFTSHNYDAQEIIVMQDGFGGRLFENESVNTIFVDGSNKKWFGTTSSGAFLLSPDGRETLFHFNKNNSPLPSNNILDISVNPITGEVFFATDLGLVSYRSFATEGQDSHQDVYAYPNPVRPGYTGYIAVKGLVSNARVKITDINGNLVHDTFAEGGQMVWDGKDLWGNRPSSGVYLVFSSDENGEENFVSKIVFVH